MTAERTMAASRRFTIGPLGVENRRGRKHRETAATWPGIIAHAVAPASKLVVPRAKLLQGKTMPSPRAGRIAWCLLVCFAVAAAAAAGPSSTLDRVKAEGAIHLGFRSGAAPFSFRERNGLVRGYSVELCTRVLGAIQKQLGLPKLAVDWTRLDASDRLDVVTSGKVDIECGTTTIALSRMERVDFSVPIFVDGGSVLTKFDAKITRLADLNGKRVAVILGTTTESALKRELAVVDAKAELVPVNDGLAGGSLLTARKAD